MLLFLGVSDRLKNVRIGVTDVSPLEVAPTLDHQINYPVCAYHPGNLNYARQMFSCTPSPIWGRYVIIQMESTTEPFLQLCEVEVFREEGNV